MDNVTRLLTKDRDAIGHLIRAGAGAVTAIDNLLSKNEAEISGLIAHLDQLSEESAFLVKDLRTGLGDPNRLGRLLTNLERTTAAITRDINPLLEKTNRFLDGAAGVADAIGPPEQKKIERALDQLLMIADRAYAVATHSETVVRTLAEGKGTAAHC